jgi:azobenzene reductase
MHPAGFGIIVQGGSPMASADAAAADVALSIPVVLGSVREGRQSERPSHLLVERLTALGCQTPLVDLRTLDLPMYGQRADAGEHASVRELQQTIAASDAAIVLTPEYNHSFTSVVKNAVDYLHSELRRKPVAVCGLSAGGLGGARAVEQLKLVLIELHAIPIRDSVYFSDARGIFDDQGVLSRPEYVARIDDLLSELIWYARTLAWGRAHLPLPVRLPR